MISLRSFSETLAASPSAISAAAPKANWRGHAVTEAAVAMRVAAAQQLADGRMFQVGQIGRQPHSGHRGQGGGRERFEFLLPERQEVGVEDDVRVQDLARVRVDPRRAHREAGVGGDPAEGVVVDVFRIPVGVVRLLAHFDGVDEAGLLERLVPLRDAVADRLAILERNRLFDPEDDRLLGRRLLGRRIRLLQMPAVDVADELVVGVLLGEILDDGQEVADAVVGSAGL